MMRNLLVSLAAVLALLGAGCTSQLAKPGPALEGAAAPAQPAPAPARPAASALDSDLIYDVLVGEIAAQRKEFDTAYVHYLAAAKRSGDIHAAERATRIALYLKDDARTLDALQQWLALEPRNVAANQVAAAIYAKTGDRDRAVEQLDQLLGIVGGDQDEAFLHVVGVVSALKNQQLRLDLMSQLVARYPDSAAGHYAYAVVAVGVNELPIAESQVRQALAIRPDWVKAQVLLSRILLAQGDAAGARSVLEDALASAAGDTDLRTAYARLLVDTKDLDAAFREFEILVEENPDDPDLLYAIGLIGLQIDRLDAAKTSFEALYESRERADQAALFLGEIAQKEGDEDAARSWFSKVRGSYYQDAQVRLARVLLAQGEIVEAQQVLQRLRLRSPEQALEIYLAEGEILREAELFEPAIEVYGEALQRFPGNAKLLYARALTAAELGLLERAEADLQQVIAEDPQHADALNALGYTLADQTTRYQEALGYIQQALALKPDNAAILDSMGWVQYRLGNYQEAAQYLRRALAQVQDSEIAAHLGEVLWQLGQHEEARRVWDAALANDPDSKHLREMLRRFR